MAVATKDFTISRNGQTTKVRRFSEASGANAVLTMVCAPAVAARLLWAGCEYSDDGTDTVVVELNSGVGAAYDALLGSFTAASLYEPNDLVIAEDDSVNFIAPAGGASQTSQVVAYFELLEAA